MIGMVRTWFRVSVMTFAVAVLLYGAASALFYLDVARVTSGGRGRRSAYGTILGDRKSVV